jgi:hypothetical protein
MLSDKMYTYFNRVLSRKCAHCAIIDENHVAFLVENAQVARQLGAKP